MINKIIRGFTNLNPFKSRDNSKKSELDLRTSKQQQKAATDSPRIVNKSLVIVNSNNTPRDRAVSELASKSFESLQTNSSLSPRSYSSSAASLIDVTSFESMQPESSPAKNLQKAGIINESEAKQIIASIEKNKKKFETKFNKNRYATFNVGSFPVHVLRSKSNPKNMEFFIETGKFLGEGAAKSVVKAVNLDGKEVALAFINHDEDNLETSQAQSKQEFNVGQVFKDSSLYTKIGNLHGLQRADGTKFDIEIMEFCGKGDLKTYLIKEGKSLDNKQHLQLFTTAARGVLEAHKQGKALHDIKLENFLVNSNGEVKVSDYGIFADVKTTTMEEYQTGTKQYFPPEITTNSDPNISELPQLAIKKDWYSLGLTGQGLLDGGKQSILIGKSPREKIDWIQQEKNKPTNDPAYQLILKLLDDNPANRASDTDVENALNHLEHLTTLYERGPTSPQETITYFENISFALKYNLVTRDQVKGVLEGVKKFEHADTVQRTQLAQTLLDHSFSLAENNIATKTIIDNLIKDLQYNKKLKIDEIKEII